MEDSLFVFIILSAWLLLTFCFYMIDVFSYNGGVCRVCNSDLYLMDINSQGGRGYRCKCCNRVRWISYPWAEDISVKFLNPLKRMV